MAFFIDFFILLSIVVLNSGIKNMLSFVIKKYKKNTKEKKERIKKNKFLSELVKKYNIKIDKKIKLKSILSFIINFSRFYFMLITIAVSVFLLILNTSNTSNAKLDYFKENQNLNQESFKNEILKNVVKSENLKSFKEYKNLNDVNFNFFDNYKNEIDFYYSNKGNTETIALIKKSGEVLYLNYIKKENNNFEVTINKNEDFINYNYNVHSTKYYKFNYMNKDSNIMSQFYTKSNFIPIENNNFFHIFLMPHLKHKTEKEKLFKNNNEVNYSYITSYPLNINYTEEEMASYEKDVIFYEFIILLYFISLIIFLISLYIPRGYYDFELIKKERDKFILKQANKKSNYQINELSYKNYKNEEININEIKNKKNIISI